MSSPGRPGESTATLLHQARSGDSTARERLIARYLPALQRWARGRLPAHARATVDTDDLVQVTVIKALARLDHLELGREGAFLAYLRTILINAIRDEIRRVNVRPRAIELDEGLESPEPSAIEQVVGRERLAAYESALLELDERQQEAVILRLELGFSHRQIAEAIGCPNANAARMVVARAVNRLAEQLGG